MTEEAATGVGGSLAELLKLLREERAEERRLWERRLEEEQKKQEQERKRHQEEMEERRRASQEQMALLQRLMEEAPRQSRTGSTRPMEMLKVSKLTEADDIEAYLTTFERVMTVQEIAAEHWALWLAPQLTGKAQQAYAALRAEEAHQYEAVKSAILRRYDISEETYRQRFRTAEPGDGESPVELTTRLRDVAEKWLKDCDTKEKVVDAIVKEQLLSTLADDVRIWVKERKPATSAEAGRLAEDYSQARETETPFKSAANEKGEKRSRSKRCHTCGEVGHLAWECRKMTGGSQQAPTSKEDQTRPGFKEVRCFNCGKDGHIARKCPNSALMSEQGTEVSPNNLHRMLRSGLVEGQRVQDILLDTGCS